MSGLSVQDKQNVTKILVHLYGNQAKNWTVNEKVYVELVKLIQNSETCTQAMHFVPRPLIAGDPLKWLQKEIVKKVLKFFLDDGSKHYLSCLAASALSKKTAIFLASQGM